jgi:hypothetical protein
VTRLSASELDAVEDDDVALLTGPVGRGLMKNENCRFWSFKFQNSDFDYNL